jgi:hypothetical protein
MMMLDALIAIGVTVVGIVCYWVGFQAGRLTKKKD